MKQMECLRKALGKLLDSPTNRDGSGRGAEAELDLARMVIARVLYCKAEAG